MGCVSGAARTDINVSNQIDKEIRKTAVIERKILLLGTGGSGKSTVMKQCRVIHRSDYSEDELMGYLQQVKTNVRNAVNDLLKCLKRVDQDLKTQYSEKIECITNLRDDFEIDGELATIVNQLMAIKDVEQFFCDLCLSELMDSSPYFLKNIQRIAAPNYIPTVEDIIHTRTQTTGIVEHRIKRVGVFLNFCDVGGQKSERKKWCQCFVDVNAILYIVGTADYDRVLPEDPSWNSLRDSITLFESLTRVPDLKNAPIIIFLNKIDLFKAKLHAVPLNVYFPGIFNCLPPEYTGSNEVNECLDFIKELFTAAGTRCSKRSIYIYESCATDTESIRFVFDACADIIFSKSLEEIGF
ncbi:Guanine nucleotide-binding protein G(i) subunit alpha [Thelohanellus kitauei]|uniref:Guanine nucleotide-binding protein G(I) subunit alpha n=1 Tax=Thelohanellus kitauei TaxID=669202 RepID=A0A0C2MPE4_THEKT|nr:Guanine nucleotide-binding protein G(i) subunit alpha [Thelohanellus kitauei]